MSISFQVFSRVFLSVRNFCWAHASEILPWIFEKNEMLVLGCGRARLVAAILTFIKTCNHNTHIQHGALVGWSVGRMVDSNPRDLPLFPASPLLCSLPSNPTARPPRNTLSHYVGTLLPLALEHFYLSSKYPWKHFLRGHFRPTPYPLA